MISGTNPLFSLKMVKIIDKAHYFCGLLWKPLRPFPREIGSDNHHRFTGFEFGVNFMIKENSTVCPAADKFRISPIGIINKQNRTVTIEIFQKYTSGLMGLNQFSHIIVCFWFHKNDEIERRHVLQVHPRGNKENPLTGVFATRSPVRPNLIGISMCKILSIRNNIIYIDQIDAFNKSPVFDIKPYIPTIDSISKATTPKWVET